MKLVQVPENPLQRYLPIALGIGLLGLALSVVGLFVSGPILFFQSYLFSYLFILELALGSLGVLMLHFLVGGRWGVAIRRVLEASTKTLWLLAILVIPIILGAGYLYPWANADRVAAEPLLQHQAHYLNMTFFIIRAVIYFIIWIFLAWFLERKARDPREFVTSPARSAFQAYNAIGLIVYVVTMTFAATDWLMSIQPSWYSTIFGMQIVVAQALSAFAFSIAIVTLLFPTEPLNNFMTPLTFRDLGAFMLTFVILWVYLAFSQFIIVWEGDLPREVSWYLIRSEGGWGWVGAAVFVFQFIVPFFVLISLRAKRSPAMLISMASMILVTRLVDNFWQVVPPFNTHGFTVTYLHILMAIGMVGLWLAVFLFFLGRTPQPEPVAEEVAPRIQTRPAPPASTTR